MKSKTLKIVLLMLISIIFIWCFENSVKAANKPQEPIPYNIMMKLVI